MQGKYWNITERVGPVIEYMSLVIISSRPHFAIHHKNKFNISTIRFETSEYITFESFWLIDFHHELLLLLYFLLLI